METLITICIVNYNSSDFILNTLYCLEKITSNPYKVIIRDNNSGTKDFLHLKQDIINHTNVELYRVENFKLAGSIAHGTALNELLTKIDTPYGVVLDADCTFLHRDWDNILINQLDQKYPIIGTQTNATPDSKRHLDFPYMYAILFDTNILKSLKIDFTPEDVSVVDTGHKLKKIYRGRGYDGKIIVFKSTRSFKSGPFKDIICDEYYLEGFKDVFACHFGRGSSLGRAKYNRGLKRYLYSIPFFGNILIKNRGKKERKKWIKICKQICDNN